jgi:hypothetical protein
MCPPLSSRMLQVILLGTVATALGCVVLAPTSGGGVPCGNNQHALATVVLPDTGINAGRELQVSFTQHELSGELSEVVIQQAAPGSTRSDSEPDPRVRLIDGNGRVFIDTRGTRSTGGATPQPTWFVLYWIRDAGSRNALYAAFTNQALWLELWGVDAAGPGMRVPLATKEVGVYPPAVCL